MSHDQQVRKGSWKNRVHVWGRTYRLILQDEQKTRKTETEITHIIHKIHKYYVYAECFTAAYYQNRKLWLQSALLGSKDRNIFIQKHISLLPSEAKMTFTFIRVDWDVWRRVNWIPGLLKNKPQQRIYQLET